MAKNVDPDQLASSGISWSGSTLFIKGGHIRVQQDQGYHIGDQQSQANLLIGVDI